MPAPAFRKQLFVVCIWLFLFFFPTRTFAYFNEDFTGNSLNFDVWQKYSNSGNVFVDNDKLTLLRSDSVSNSFPYLYSKTNLFPESEPFSIYISFKYLTAGNFGDGITISPEAAPINGQNPTSDSSSFFAFYIWQDKPNGLSYNKVLCNFDGTKCNEHEPIYPYTHVADFDSHIIRIDYTYEGRYQIFIDNNSIADYISDVNQKKPSKIWIGNSHTTGSLDYWSSFEIDYIRVTPLKSTIPVILIPGLGASWDIGAILTGSEGGNWQIPKFVKNYDGLVNSFVAAGYKVEGPDKNLYVFSYDWRKPLSLLATKLNDFINTNLPGEEVNLVGHSMGGLVARAYAQTYVNHNINKIITVGSPNMGTVQAYSPWEGAVLMNDTWWGKVALALTTHFGAIEEESNIQTIQRMVPSLKDLLPTYDYLNLDGSIIPWSSLVNKNTYLNNLNQDVSQINTLTTAIYSNDEPTDSLIKVVAHTNEDLDAWVDGKPIDNSLITDPGDGTVTTVSAVGPFDHILQGTGWHGELVTKTDNIQKIFSVLGLDQSKASSVVYDNRQRVFVAALRSPGFLEVCDMVKAKCNAELGLYFLEDKLFILPGYNNEGLVVKVKENGKGIYHLHLGDINENANWTIKNGSLDNIGEVDEYDVSSNGQSLTVTTPDITLPTTPVITGFKNPSLSCGGITNSKYITVDWTDSTDMGGIAGYEYYVDYPLPNGVGREIWNPSTLWTISENYGSLNEGVHHIKVKAKDRAGNTSEWSSVCDITYDSIKPILVDKTIFSGWYNSSQTSIFKYTDTNMRTDYVDLACDITTEGNNQTCIVSPSICDTAGNCNTDLQKSNGANIDMSSPKSDFNLSELSNNWNGNISGTASDRVSGVAKVELIIKNPAGIETTILADGTTNWSYKIPVLTNGRYVIKSRATDIAGNVETNLVTKQIVLDTMAPKTPKTIFVNDWRQKILSAWWPVHDANLYRVYYGLQPNVLKMIETHNPYWISTILTPGKYYVSVSAVDKAGNESPKSRLEQVRVQKTWWKW